MAIQSAVACSEVKDDGLSVSCQLMERVLVWVVSFSLAVEDGFLFIMDESFDFSVGQMRRGLLFFPSCFPPILKSRFESQRGHEVSGFSMWHFLEFVVGHFLWAILFPPLHL